jgi:F0F1-type ATP synthase membrane subunit b/b'
MQTFDQTIIYALLLTIVALVMLGVGLIIVYIRSVKKYNELRDKKEAKEPNADPQVILANAQNKSQQILQDASTRANEIISKAQVFTGDQEGKIAAEIEKASQMYAGSYQESLKALESKAVTMMQTIPNEVKDVLLREITNIRTTIQSQIQKAQSDARQIVVDAYKKAEDEVVNYKKQRLKQVDESIVVILQDIARKVLSKEISKEEHEKLVMKALEEAKRSGAFGVSAQVQVADVETGMQSADDQTAQTTNEQEQSSENTSNIEAGNNISGEPATTADQAETGISTEEPSSANVSQTKNSTTNTSVDSSALPEGYQYDAMPNQASGMDVSTASNPNDNQDDAS